MGQREPKPLDLLFHLVDTVTHIIVWPSLRLHLEIHTYGQCLTHGTLQFGVRSHGDKLKLVDFFFK